MKKGTLLCKLFGHKFHGQRIEYDPHYLEGVKKGTVSIRTMNDYRMVGFRTDYCVRCGIKDND